MNFLNSQVYFSCLCFFFYFYCLFLLFSFILFISFFQWQKIKTVNSFLWKKKKKYIFAYPIVFVYRMNSRINIVSIFFERKIFSFLILLLLRCYDHRIFPSSFYDSELFNVLGSFNHTAYAAIYLFLSSISFPSSSSFNVQSFHLFSSP